MTVHGYPLLTRLIMLVGAAFAPVVGAQSWLAGEKVRWWAWLILGGVSLVSAWWCWLLRGKVLLGSQGIGMRLGGAESWIAWQRIERVERRRLWGAVRIHGDGHTIAFIDQLDGYQHVCDEVGARAPQWIRQEGLRVPFTLRASAFSWIALALFAGGGLSLIVFAWAGPSEPANDWWARPAVALLGVAFAGFGVGRFVRSIEFERTEIVVRYLVRPAQRFPAAQLSAVRDATFSHRGSRVSAIELVFNGGRKLGIGPYQFDRPVSVIRDALRDSYRLP